MDREAKKKEEEKAIISLIFKEEILEEIVSSETPDFLATDKKNGLNVGFEVTKVFPNQASAIQFYDSGFHDRFIQNHFNKKKKRRIEDLYKNLTVIEVTGDAVVAEQTILWRNSLNDFFDFFHRKILEKNKSYKNLPENIVSVSLIAYDITNFILTHNFEPGTFYLLIRQHPIFEQFLNSVFQEIILIVRFQKGLYHIKIRRIIFLTEFAIFNEHWMSLQINQKTKENHLTKMNNYIICLLFLGFRNIYLTSDENHRYVLFGNTYWKIKKNNGELKEINFLAIELKNFIKAEVMLTNWENYKATFEKYLTFRNSFHPILNSGYFSFHKK